MAVVFEPEYQAVLDYAIANSITTPSSFQNNINNAIIVALKALGVWSKLRLFYFMRQTGALANFVKINWVSPNDFYCTEIGTPEFVSGSGFRNNHNQGSLNTNFNPSLNFSPMTATNFSFVWKMFDIANVDSSQAPMFGCRTGNNSSQILVFKSQQAELGHRIIQTSLVTGGTDLNAEFHKSRVGIANNLYENAINISTASSTVGSPPNLNIYLLSYNNNGTTAYFDINSGMEYFMCGTPFNTDALEVYNIMNP